LNIPAEFFQGDSVAWHDPAIRSLDGRSITSPDWTLIYYFGGPTIFQVTGTPKGGGWDLTLSPAQTSAMTPSPTPNYAWQAVATSGTQRLTVGSGTARTVRTFQGATAPVDTRSQDEIDLAAVQAAIRARIAGGGIAEYAIGSRRLRNEGMTELLKIEGTIKARIRRSRRRQSIANGQGDPTISYVSFTR
jgi:hypothetical protein